MFLISKDGSIKLTRGDTAWFEVPIDRVINDEVAEAYEMKATDTLEFSVKKKYKHDEPLIHKSIVGTNTFHLEPADTEALDFGRYWYDVQLTTEHGDVFTVVEANTFEIAKEVTH